MSNSPIRLVARLVSVPFFYVAIATYLNNPNWAWWSPLYAGSALSLLLLNPDCKYWRLLSSITLVGGALHIYFQWWTLEALWPILAEHAEKGQRVPEARHLAISSTAVALVGFVRLVFRASNGTNSVVLRLLRDVFTFVIFALAAACVAAAFTLMAPVRMLERFHEEL